MSPGIEARSRCFVASRAEDWIATLTELKGLERVQVDPPTIVRDLATGGEARYDKDQDGARFVILPAYVYGIDNAVAYIYSFDGKPPTERVYNQIVKIERIDAHWYLVKTT